MSNHVPNSKPRRRLTVRDFMVLIVAAAIGLAWTRAAWDDNAINEAYLYRQTGTQSVPPPIFKALDAVTWWVRQTCPFFAPITIAVLCVRLVGSRARLRRIARQPGSVACAAVSAAVAFQVSAQWLERTAYTMFVARHGRWMVIDQFSPLRLTGDLPCASVAFSWMLLCASGRWKHERDWIDRAGIALGLYWLTEPTLSWAIDLLAIAVQ